MPNRVLRDWTDSFTIDELDVHSERFFTRLIMKVDDYGRFYADSRLLRSNLFPLKTDVRDTDISRWLAACEKAGLIAIYNVANREFLQITNFKQQLRQKKIKHPPPKDDTQMHSNGVANAHVETKQKRNETSVALGLLESNLFRKPKIPTKEEVLQAFLSNGGTEEMAKKFYETYDSIGWYYKNSPITNFNTLVFSYVDNWIKISKNSKQRAETNSAPPLKRAN